MIVVDSVSRDCISVNNFISVLGDQKVKQGKENGKAIECLFCASAQLFCINFLSYITQINTNAALRYCQHLQLRCFSVKLRASDTVSCPLGFTSPYLRPNWF